jgi:hypothetical protein
MIQELIDGIITALREEYPDVVIYDEKVKQGFKTPCFVIRCINPINEQLLGNRFHQRNLFSIQYITDDESANTECYKVLDNLFRILTYIKSGKNEDLRHGTNMRGEVLDGVLTMLIEFNMFIIYGEQVESMDELEHLPTNVNQEV